MKTVIVYLVSNFMRDEQQWVKSRNEAIRLAKTQYADATGMPGWVDQYVIPAPHSPSRQFVCNLLEGSGFAAAIHPVAIPGTPKFLDPEDCDENATPVLRLA